MRATDGSGLRKRQQGFAAVPNDTVWDDELPTRALGVLTKLIALPEDWKLDTDWLVGKCPDGREAVMTALRHLRRLGYYRVERRRKGDGRFVTGVSVSDVRVPEWAAQHARACADQGTERPKWDTTLRLLDDGRVEDEPAKGPVDGGSDRPPVANMQVTPETGFPVPGEPVPVDPDSGEPASGLPDVRTQKETQTEIQGGSVTGVRHLADDDVDEPPQDIPDGIQRVCRAHQVRPATGPCGRCADWRRAADTAVVEAQALAAVRAQEARIEAAEAARRARELTDAEVRACGLCNEHGRLPTGLVCLHDPTRNPRPDSGGYAAFQELRARGVKRSSDGRDPAKGRKRALAEREG